MADVHKISMQFVPESKCSNGDFTDLAQLLFSLWKSSVQEHHLPSAYLSRRVAENYKIRMGNGWVVLSVKRQVKYLKKREG